MGHTLTCAVLLSGQLIVEINVRTNNHTLGHHAAETHMRINGAQDPSMTSQGLVEILYPLPIQNQSVHEVSLKYYTNILYDYSIKHACIFYDLR